MICYKIVEKKDENIKFLFHGIQGSRIAKKNTWIQADKKIVSDGKDGTQYLSGFHVLLDYAECVDYLKKFKDKDNKAIVVCECKGLRRKEHSLHNVFLTDYIKFI